MLVTGGRGQLGTDLERCFARFGHHQVNAPGRDSLDVADRDQVLQVTGVLGPELIIHAAAWTAVDACESDPDRAWRVNALGSRHVAEAARLLGAHLVYVSTDYVFDGSLSRPYNEWDQPAPASAYGRSKLAGEREVLTQVPAAAVVRTSWVCGCHGSNMAKTVLRLAGLLADPATPAGAPPSAGVRLRFVDDQRGCPTFTEDLASMIYRLGVARLPGVFHVTNQGPTTWYGFARDVLAAAGADPEMVEPVSTASLIPPRPAPRPANSVLDNAALRLAGIPLLADYHEPLARTVKGLLAGRPGEECLSR